jgi:hypothetical protein
MRNSTDLMSAFSMNTTAKTMKNMSDHDHTAHEACVDDGDAVAVDAEAVHALLAVDVAKVDHCHAANEELKGDVEDDLGVVDENVVEGVADQVDAVDEDAVKGEEDHVDAVDEVAIAPGSSDDAIRKKPAAWKPMPNTPAPVEAASVETSLISSLSDFFNISSVMPCT